MNDKRGVIFKQFGFSYEIDTRKKTVSIQYIDLKTYFWKSLV